MTTIHTPSNESMERSKIFHEIKNPLALISSSLQLIEQEHPEVTGYRFWTQTRKDLQGLCSLLNDLSEFEKSSFLNRRLISVFDFVEDLVEATEPFLLEHGNPLILESIREELDFCGDECKLRQAVVNLIKNAAESSPEGCPIMLSVTDDSQELLIMVQDHGCGMSKELQEHIFEPFHTTKAYGTGMGLPIVQQIVAAHEGSITIASEEHSGTSITLHLPL